MIKLWQSHKWQKFPSFFSVCFSCHPLRNVKMAATLWKIATPTLPRCVTVPSHHLVHALLICFITLIVYVLNCLLITVCWNFQALLSSMYATGNIKYNPQESRVAHDTFSLKDYCNVIPPASFSMPCSFSDLKALPPNTMFPNPAYSLWQAQRPSSSASSDYPLTCSISSKQNEQHSSSEDFKYYTFVICDIPSPLSGLYAFREMNF